MSFSSTGWDGRVSDVHLTEHSGLVKNLLPDDVILVDRGFMIQDSAGMYCDTCIYEREKKNLAKWK